MSDLLPVSKKIAAYGALALGACLASLLAQAPPDKGKQLFDQALAALGGDKFLQMQTRVEAGRIYSFFHDQMSGYDVTTTYVQYLASKPANGLALKEREILGKKKDYSYLFLENQAFDITYRGARPIPDESWDRYQRDTESDILYILRVRHDEPGLIFDYIGSDVYLSAHVEVLDITDAQNRVVRVYFDHNTLYPVRETFSWLDPSTHQHNDEEINYDKYRDAGGGVMWPFTIERERNGYKTYQMFASKVEVNQSVPSNVFDLPPGAQILRKVN